ncbi:glycosyltransferase family 2 protein [Candidatus Omnitrophota bacterium]
MDKESKKNLISIVTPCYNEEGNVEELYKQIRDLMGALDKYEYEHIFIDNASKDNTTDILKRLAKYDKRLKIIINTRNFGWVRSPNYVIHQAQGDAVISIAADLQDPPDLIREFIKYWEEGYKVVAGVKSKSEEFFLMRIVRNAFYDFINKVSEVEQLKNFTGYGLYDREVVEYLKKMKDSYPYFRGLICEIGYDIKKVEYLQRKRRKGRSSSDFYKLYDVAMLGIMNTSKIPLRIATFMGFLLSAFSILVAFIYFILKLLLWMAFPIGMAPIVIGIFLFSSVQLLFIGIIGEYIGATYTQVLHRPLVVEKERINF